MHTDINDICLLLINPVNNQPYYKGDLWNCKYVELIVPLRNIYTIKEFDVYIPKNIFFEDECRWKGYSLLFFKLKNKPIIDKYFPISTISFLITPNSTIWNECKPLIETVLIKWPYQMAIRFIQIIYYIKNFKSTQIIPIPRGGLWMFNYLKSIEKIHKVKLDLFDSLSTNFEKTVIIFDETIGSGSTFKKYLQDLGSCQIRLITLGSTFSSEEYSRKLGIKQLNLFFPEPNWINLGFRIFENCPELLGVDLIDGIVIPINTVVKKIFEMRITENILNILKMYKSANNMTL